jgi:hypothetical protein
MIRKEIFKNTFIVTSFLGLFLSASTTSALAESRVALVIGNSNYQHVPRLPNPIRDSRAISKMIKQLNFEVTEIHDGDFNKIRAALKLFGRTTTTADIAAFYYAGHGIEVDRENYLIPVDATLKNDKDVEFEALPLSLTMVAVGSAQRLSLIILDACRDNPFANKMVKRGITRSIGRGLGEIEPVGDTLVAYAAKAGSVAEDGRGANSPYTRALLKHLPEPGLEIGMAFRRIRDTVLSTTGGRQEPFVYGSLGSKSIYLKSQVTKSLRHGDQLGGSNQNLDPERSYKGYADLIFWKEISESNRPEDFDAYLKQFPEGLFANLAKRRLRSLGGNKKVPVEKNVLQPPAGMNTLKNEALRPTTNASNKINDQKLSISRKIEKIIKEGPHSNCDFYVDRWEDATSHDMCIERQIQIKKLKKELDQIDK